MNVRKDEIAESRYTVSVQQEIIDFLCINCKADASDTWEKLLQISRRIPASSLSCWARCNTKQNFWKIKIFFAYIRLMIVFTNFENLLQN